MQPLPLWASLRRCVGCSSRRALAAKRERNTGQTQARRGLDGEEWRRKSDAMLTRLLSVLCNAHRAAPTPLLFLSGRFTDLLFETVSRSVAYECIQTTTARRMILSHGSRR